MSKKIRVEISKLKRKLKTASSEEKEAIIKKICNFKEVLDSGYDLPTLGKLRMVIEKEVQKEQDEIDQSNNPSENDYKRLALKQSFLEYYQDLDYDYDAVVVEKMNDNNLRRDNKRVDGTDLDFAPNAKDIYQRWMEKLKELVRHDKISYHELDEAIERGIPQGGAFEKQLQRFKNDVIRKLWEK